MRRLPLLLLSISGAAALAAGENSTVNVRTDFGADNTGAADATGAISKALAAVVASGKKALYIPAGTYKISGAAGTLFQLPVSAPGTCVYGDGPGATVLQYANNVTLKGDVTVFSFGGSNQCLHDVSILNGAGMAGSFNWTALYAGNGAFNPHLYNFEVAGIYGFRTAGGAGVATYQPYSQTMVNTTAGASIAPGSQSVTPGSMAFIYVGQKLLMGGAAPESVMVTAKTATTFTATFANPHSASDPIRSNSQGYQGAVIENCYIHDSYRATAIILNSSSNVVKACRIVNVGSNSTQHAIYDQGGTNRIEHNYIEGVSGYGIHGHKAVPREDSSGAVYDGNTIVNYATNCMVLDSISSDGVNPEVPNGVELNRYAVVQNNTCRERAGVGSSGIVAGLNIQAPALVSNNTLEDACGNTPRCIWIAVSTAGSAVSCSVSQNYISVLNVNPSKAQTAISLGQPYCESNQNRIANWNQDAGAIRLNGMNTSSHGDSVNGSPTFASRCVVLNANNVEVSGLHCASDSIGVHAAQAVTGVRIRDSIIAMRTSGLKALDAGGMQGVISDIQIPTGVLSYGAADAARTLVIRNIDGRVVWNNTSTAGTAVSSMGRFLDFPASANIITQGLAVKLDGSGNAANADTTDTVFVGWALSGKTSASGSIFIAGQIGSEVPAWATDGAWTTGHYGVLSTTEAGKLHDNGTTPPSSGSYVMFLDQGEAAGEARVLIVKTL